MGCKVAGAKRSFNTGIVEINQDCLRGITIALFWLLVMLRSATVQVVHKVL